MDDLKEHWRRFCADLRQDNFLPIYTATERVVWTICWRVLRDEADARDAFQAAYTRLLVEARASRKAVAEDPAALALRFAALEAKALASRRARLAKREVATVDEHLEDTDSISARTGLGGEQLRALLEREADRLEDDLRLPVELHFFDGMTQREVGEVLGVSVSTVNDRLKRALERLRPLLRRAGIERPEDALPLLLPLAMLLAPPADLSAAAVFAEARVASAAGTVGTGTKVAGGAALLAKIAVMLLLAVAIVWAALMRRGTSPASGNATPLQVAAVATPKAAPESPMQLPIATGVVATPAPAPTPTAAPTGLALGGVVVDELTGAPVGGATIHLGALPTDGLPKNQYRDLRPVASTVASPEGEFDFVGLPPGSYALFVDSETHILIDDAGFMLEPVELLPGKNERNLRLGAWPGNTVSGTVKDADTGELLAGVHVASTNYVLQTWRKRFGVANAKLEESEALTGADGRYDLSPVFGSSNDVAVNGVSSPGRAAILDFGKEGYTTRHTKYPLGWLPFSNVPLSKDWRAVGRDLALMQAVKCHLLVTDLSGISIAGAEAVDFYPFGTGSPNTVVATTDGAGAADLMVPRGIEFRFRVDAVGYVAAAVGLTLEAENADSPVRVNMESLAGRRLEFRLAGEDGHPIPDYRVHAKQTRLEGEPVYTGMLDFSAADGIYRVRNFEPSVIKRGEMILTTMEDSRFLPLHYQVRVEDMTAPEPVVLTLQKRPVDRVVTGTIRDEEGNGLADAFVSTPGDFAVTRTDNSGRYEIGISSEVKMLIVRHRVHGVSAIRELREGENDLDWGKANAVVELHLNWVAWDKRPKERISTDEQWSQNCVRDAVHPNIFYVEQGIQPGRIKCNLMMAGAVFYPLDIEVPAGELYFKRSVELNPSPGRLFHKIEVPAGESDPNKYIEPNPSAVRLTKAVK